MWGLWNMGENPLGLELTEAAEGDRAALLQRSIPGRAMLQRCPDLYPLHLSSPPHTSRPSPPNQVPPSFVVVQVAAGSVIITAIITVPVGSTASGVTNALTRSEEHT